MLGELVVKTEAPPGQMTGYGGPFAPCSCHSLRSTHVRSIGSFVLVMVVRSKVEISEVVYSKIKLFMLTLYMFRGGGAGTIVALHVL